LKRITLVTTALALNLAYPHISLAASQTNSVPQPTSTAKNQTASDKKKTQAPEKTPSVDDSATGLEEMVVSATKTETLLSNAPAVVTVINQKDMDARNVSRLGDALSKVPSLFLGQNAQGQTPGASGTGNFTLRGVNTQRTLVLMDGQPMQNGSSNALDWRSMMVDDIERVEVVPGAFSSLYGSSAIGGVINVIGKHADKHELTIRGKKGFMDAEGEDTSIYFREHFNNGFGIVAGFGYQGRDGYESELNARPVVAGAAGTRVTGAIPTVTSQGAPAYIVGAKGRTPWTQINATAKVEFEPNDKHRLYAGWSFSDFSTGYSPLTTYLRNAQGVPVTSGTLGINGSRVALTESTFAAASPSSPLNQGSSRYFGGYEYHFTPETLLKATVAYIDRPYAYSTLDTTATQFSGTGVKTDGPNNGLDADLQLNIPLHLTMLPVAKDHIFVTGASYHREAVKQTNYVLSNWRDLDSETGRVNNGYHGESGIYSLYAQDEISIIDPLTLYVGGRVNWWETQGNYFQNTAPVFSTTFKQRSQTNFTPKVSAVYRPLDELTLRASWGQSFRAPANSDLYSVSRIVNSNSPTGYSTTTSNPNISPETATSWEAGAEWRITPKVTVGATYYETLMKDMIYSKTIDLSLTERINAGKAQIHGVELSFGAKPLDWLELYANYGYVGSKMLSNPADATSVGKRLTASPKHIAKGGIIANYQGWSGTLEANYFSHMFNQSNNSDTVEGVPGSYSAYTVLNAKLGYQVTHHIKINTAVNNLLDKQYYQFLLMPGINVTTELVLSF
jgi:iron complex outermembrane receptor protein